VDVTNPITPDHKSLLIGHTTSGAEEIAKLLGESYVVKALNAAFAEVYTGQDPRIDEQTVSIFFAGDDTQKTRWENSSAASASIPWMPGLCKTRVISSRSRCSISISVASWDSALISASRSFAKAAPRRATIHF
jgi:hypothetical protein